LKGEGKVGVRKGALRLRLKARTHKDGRAALLKAQGKNGFRMRGALRLRLKARMHKDGRAALLKA